MRKLSLVVVAALLLSSSSMFANDLEKGDKPSKSQNLSEQISSMLQKNKFTKNECGNAAQVLFTINDDKEIVVLSVDTDEKHIEGFIKNRLNYKKVALKNYKEGKKYTISVRIAS